MNTIPQLTTKTDYQLLAFFLLNSQRTISLNEIKQSIKLPLKEIAKSLEKLVAAKIIQKSSRYPVAIYMVRELSSELKVIAFDLKKKYPNRDKVLNLLKSLKGLDFSLLGGVFLEEKTHKVDLVLVGDFDIKKAREAVMHIEQLYGFDLQFCIFDPTEFELRLAALDVFLRDIVESRHLRFSKGVIELVKK